jgi:preprotein translocase subunit SecG
MEIIRILLLVVEAICALLLIGVILLQKSKSEGLGVAFGSGMGETLFGSRAGNVLTKITITLGITFLVTTTLLAIISTSSREQSLIDERVADVPMAPAQAPQNVAPPASITPDMTPAAAPAPAVDYQAQPAPAAPPAEAPVAPATP